MINYQNLRRITGTSWSVLRHTENLWFFYHDDFSNIQTRGDTISEEMHISLFLRRQGADHHATFAFTNKYGQFFKRHHGVRYRQGRQEFKSNNNPQLKYLFSLFEADIPMLIPNHIQRLMVSFTKIMIKLIWF